jgi:hypothetical protein
MNDIKTDGFVVRRTEKEIIRVEPDGQDRGRILVYMVPNEGQRFDIFHVGISWDSLRKLQERTLCDIFSWEVADGSLKVRGRASRWHLFFHNRRTAAEFDVLLSEDETVSLKSVLLQDLSEPQ